APRSEKPHRGAAHPVLPGTARPSPGVRNSPPRNHRCQGRRVPPPLAALPAGPDIRTVYDSGSHWAETTNPRSLPRDPCYPRYRSLRTCFPPAPKRLLPIRTAVCGPTTTDGGGHHPREEGGRPPPSVQQTVLTGGRDRSRSLPTARRPSNLGRRCTHSVLHSPKPSTSRPWPPRWAPP